MTGFVSAGTFSDIPDSGVSRWKFEQDVTDSWGNNDGTNNGGSFTTTTLSPDGSYALDFSEGDYVDTPLDMGGPAEVSVAVWVDVSSLTADYVRIAGQHNSYALLADWNGDKTFQVRTSDGSTESFATSSTDLTSVGSRLCVLTYSASNTRLRAYLDDTMVGENTSAVQPQDNGQQFQINKTTNSNADLVGIQDDPRVYNKELTATEVSNLHSTGSING